MPSISDHIAPHFLYLELETAPHIERPYRSPLGIGGATLILSPEEEFALAHSEKGKA